MVQVLQIEIIRSRTLSRSKSVTVRTVFLPYLLQIEIFISRPRAMSQSVTARHVFRLLVLQIETNTEPDNPSNKKRALSHIKTEPETLMEPVTGSPRIRFANPLRLRMPAGIPARSLRTLRVRLTLAPLRVRFRHIQETGPVLTKEQDPKLSWSQ